MSTLADELLNDFEESGSEGEDEQQNGFLQESATPPTAGHDPSSMLLDGDEEDEAEDEENGTNIASKLDDVDDEEEAKAKVEKMQLGGVSNVRTVASLMKTLEPVLEVSRCRYPLRAVIARFTEHVDIALTFSVASRKSPITKAYPPRNKPPSLDPSKITPNITCLHKPTPYRPPSITKSSWFTSLSEITTPHASLNSKRSSQTRLTTRRPSLLSAMVRWRVSRKYLRRQTTSSTLL